ncbi:hydroxysqualene dehydroxylase HpnE [Neisseria sp. S1]|uniref:hydroxysqualene dehydroxylase HpnE n=1 Tax=Neisseria sp. S1 TaxID=3318354 RepID=UPI003A835E5E
MKNPARKKIAVIGAGWAGLSAAIHLSAKADVTIFEAGKQAGGRARALNAVDHNFSFLDNGQHILLGAYHGVRTLLNRIGVNEAEVFERRPLQWYMADGLQFSASSRLPAPLHLITGILRAKNIGWADKIRLLDSMKALQKRQHFNPADMSVADWLNARQMPRKLVAEFWQPLVWGALNTPLQNASLNILSNVLQDGVWADKAAGDYLLPKCDLGKLMAEPALSFLKKQKATIRLATRVGKLQISPDGRVRIENELFDAVILAVAPYHAAALMPAETPHYIQSEYSKIQYHAITTVYLRYAEALEMPSAMTGFSRGTAQWLISRGALDGDKHELTAVISVSDLHSNHTNEQWIERVHADILRICPTLKAPVAARVITEKRATTASTVNRRLPDTVWLHHHHIYPCGDYLHPRYPATLEAAVQHGQSTAALCLNNLTA